MTVLVTGFGAFGTEVVNPSGQVAESLAGTELSGERVEGVVLPVSTGRVATLVVEALERFRPRLVLTLGLAAGRSAPALERVAINVRDFPIPDVDGEQPGGGPVVESGPDAYLTDLPIKAVLSGWKDQQIPGYVSNTAGTYLCNQVFYLASHHGRIHRTRVGLIHLPSTPEAVADSHRSGERPVPTMDLGLLERAVRLAVEVSLRHEGTDIGVPAGSLC